MREKTRKWAAGIVASLLAFTMVLGIAGTAQAETVYTQFGPTVHYTGPLNQSVSWGNKYRYPFQLDSHYYGYRYGYRSRFNINMYRNKVKKANKVDTLAKYLRFSGRFTHNVNWTYGRAYYRGGTYKMRYYTQYRAYASSAYPWKLSCRGTITVHVH